MTSLQALEETIEAGLFTNAHRKTPGAIVSRMPREYRLALERLTSVDTLNQRPDWIKKT